MWDTSAVGGSLTCCTAMLALVLLFKSILTMSILIELLKNRPFVLNVVVSVIRLKATIFVFGLLAIYTFLFYDCSKVYGHTIIV